MNSGGWFFSNPFRRAPSREERAAAPAAPSPPSVMPPSLLPMPVGVLGGINATTTTPARQDRGGGRRDKSMSPTKFRSTFHSVEVTPRRRRSSGHTTPMPHESAPPQLPPIKIADEDFFEHPEASSKLPAVVVAAAAAAHRRDDVDSSISALRSRHMEIQAKVFTKWCNMHLSKLKGPEAQINFIESDFRDGTNLLLLLRSLMENGQSGANVDFKPENGGLRIHRIATVGKALKILEDWLSSTSANFGGPSPIIRFDVAAEEIVDGDIKLTMGLLWSIILLFSSTSIPLPSIPKSAKILTPPSSRTASPSRRDDSPSRVGKRSALSSVRDSMTLRSYPKNSAKESLLFWCQTMLGPYVDAGLLKRVTDFTRSWISGVPFLALIHTYDASLVPDLTAAFISPKASRGRQRNNAFKANTANKDDMKETLCRAFALAADHMNVSPLLDPEDLTDVNEPDEKSVMCYVFQFRDVLKDFKPFDLKSALLASNPSTRPAQISSSTSSDVQRSTGLNLSEFLTESNKLSTWLVRQQSVIQRLSWILTSSRTVPANSMFGSKSSSWSSKIIRALSDSDVNGSMDSINHLISSQMDGLRSVVDALALKDDSFGSIDVFAHSELTLSDMSPVTTLLKLEGLRAGLMRSRNTEELEQIEETHEGIMTQIKSFVEDVFPPFSDLMASYVQYCTEVIEAVNAFKLALSEEPAQLSQATAKKLSAQLEMAAIQPQRTFKFILLPSFLDAEIAAIRSKLAMFDVTNALVQGGLDSVETLIGDLEADVIDCLSNRAPFSDKLDFLQEKANNLQSAIGEPLLARFTALIESIALASSFNNALIEIAHSKETLCSRLERVTMIDKSIDVPHGLDDEEFCNEAILAELERQAAMADNEMDDWQKLKRKARLEQAIASLMSLSPPLEIKDFVETEAKNLLSLVAQVLDISNQKWQRLTNAGAALREVAAPGRRLRSVIREIGQDVEAATDSWRKNCSESGCESAAALMSHLRWLSDQVSSLLDQSNSVVASAKSYDQRTVDYADVILEDLDSVTTALAILGISILNESFSKWDIGMTEVEVTCESIKHDASRYAEISSIEESLQTFESLSIRITEFNLKLEKSNEWTKTLIRVARDWSGLPFDDQARSCVSNKFLSALMLSLEGIVVENATRGAGDFLCDNIRDRAEQVRLRGAQTEHFVVREAIPFYKRCVELKQEMLRMETEIQVNLEILRSVSFQSANSALIIEETVLNVERGIEDGKKSVDIIAQALDDLGSHQISSATQDDTAGVMATLFSTFNKFQDLLIVYGKASSCYKTAYDSVFKRIYDVEERLAALDVYCKSLDLALTEDAQCIAANKAIDALSYLERHSSDSAAVNRHESTLVSIKQILAEVSEGIVNLDYSEEAPYVATAVEAALSGSYEKAESLAALFVIVRSRITSREKLLQWVNQCHELVNRSIHETITRLENGDGWSTVLSETNITELDDMVFDNFGRWCDVVVRAWEEDLLNIESKAEHLKGDGAQSLIMEFHSEVDQDLSAAVVSHEESLLNAAIAKLQHTFEELKSRLFKLSSYLDSFVISSAPLVPRLNDIMAEVRNRTGSGGNSSELYAQNIRRPQTPSSLGGSRLVTVGDNFSGIMKWSSDVDATEQLLHNEIWPKVKEAEDSLGCLEDSCQSVLRGTVRLLVLGGARQRVDDVKVAFREVQRVFLIEKQAVERARRYHEWHTSLGQIEEQVAELQDHLSHLSDSYDNHPIAAILSECDDVKQKLDALYSASIGSQRRRSNASSQNSPHSPTDAGFVNLATSHRDLAPPTSTRRLSVTLLSVSDASDLANSSAFTARYESVVEKLAEVQSAVLRLQEDGRLRHSDLIRLNSWSQSAIENITRTSNELARALNLLNTEVLESSEEVFDILIAAGKTLALIDLEFKQGRNALLEIGGEEGFDHPDVLSAQELLDQVDRMRIDVEQTLVHDARPLFGIDRDAADLLGWINSAVAAGRAILNRDHTTTDATAEAAFEENHEAQELEERVELFRETLSSFLRAAEERRNGSNVDDSHCAIEVKTSQVLHRFDELVSVLSSIHGSAASKARMEDFNREVQSIVQILSDIRSRLAHVAGSDGSDIEALTVLHELDGEVEGVVLPKLADLSDHAAAACTTFERSMYMKAQSQLSDEIQSLIAWIGREKKDSNSSLQLRSFERSADTVLRLIAEFSKILHTMATSMPNTGSRTIAELEGAIAELESRYTWYNREIVSSMEALIVLARETGCDVRYGELQKKWESMTRMKGKLGDQLTSRIYARKASSKSQIPRYTSIRSGTVSPAFSNRSGSPMRTPSPGSTFSASSSANGERRGSGLPVRIILPSPNQYIPNKDDPLDVEIAKIVNASPHIKVVNASGGRYWFGDLMPKNCYCRLVRSGVVMVRVGGGWQELSSFLMEHSNLEATLPQVRSFLPSTSDGHERRTGKVVTLSPESSQNPYSLSFNRAFHKSDD